MSEDQIIFLGTGGGRFSMITQRRRTGGIRLTGSSNMQIDPGPGSLAYSTQLNLDPTKVDSLLVSHCHPDHDNDAEIYIEAMTNGGTRKRGTLIAPKGVISGNSSCEPRISDYHKKMVNRLIEVAPGMIVDLGTAHVKTVSAKHQDPDSVGFRINVPSGEIGYTSDTEYFEGIEDQFRNLKLLIMCILRPRGAPIKGHLCTDDAIRILIGTKPEACVITGFGMRMIYANPDNEARIIEESSKVKTIAAKDSMKISLDSDILRSREKQQSLGAILD